MIPSVRARWADLPPDGGPITIEELLTLPEDRWRYELVDGRLVPRPPLDMRYATITSGLAEAVRLWARETDAGGVTLVETGFVVSAPGELDTVYVAALAYVGGERRMAGDGSAGGGSGGISAGDVSSVRLVPELVVEIAAPGQSRTALAARAARWLIAGVRVVWTVWPAHRQVDVWTLGTSGPLVATCAVHETLKDMAELVGFEYPVAHVFV
jgi:Uma2 family endonuclease